ncbi:unnamed protein product [Vitrella brassicaformis CCMP3155]|uniref:Uncharacterized protein n=1 Tax=Vitrella brassicaformis (strain CCMP3155) TaxID=1169540 RepID=A0A0G4EH49_VITBC|nr:unnamed protein product [Vitrella brassicaformis CCMP3155]|eukprot:CEL95339.1 unnamed protein product [Vitrella brassicaformis CCMP3155]
METSSMDPFAAHPSQEIEDSSTLSLDSDAHQEALLMFIHNQALEVKAVPVDYCSIRNKRLQLYIDTNARDTAVSIVNEFITSSHEWRNAKDGELPVEAACRAAEMLDRFLSITPHVSQTHLWGLAAASLWAALKAEGYHGGGRLLAPHVCQMWNRTVCQMWNQTEEAEHWEATIDKETLCACECHLYQALEWDVTSTPHVWTFVNVLMLVEGMYDDWQYEERVRSLVLESLACYNIAVRRGFRQSQIACAAVFITLNMGSRQTYWPPSFMDLDVSVQDVASAVSAMLTNLRTRCLLHAKGFQLHNVERALHEITASSSRHSISASFNRGALPPRPATPPQPQAHGRSQRKRKERKNRDMCGMCGATEDIVYGGCGGCDALLCLTCERRAYRRNNQCPFCSRQLPAHVPFPPPPAYTHDTPDHHQQQQLHMHDDNALPPSYSGDGEGMDNGERMELCAAPLNFPSLFAAGLDTGFHVGRQAADRHHPTPAPPPPNPGNTQQIDHMHMAVHYLDHYDHDKQMMG